MVNEAAAGVPGVVNLGQGFFGYNPPRYVIEAAKDALEKVDCNQYAPTKVIYNRDLVAVDPFDIDL